MKHTLEEINVGIETLTECRDLYHKNREQLEAYIDQLFEWNEKINLVSRNVSRETIREHIVHSLIPVPLKLLQTHNEWIDAGTGGGLPGIPLAICEKNKDWVLNDNVKKKMRAVGDMIQALNLKNCSVNPQSISLVGLEKGIGIVTKHAFKIEDLLRLLGSKPWKTIIMWKGADDAVSEIIKSKKKLRVTIYRFDFGTDESFYEGKGLIKIER